jgi:cytochrome P450
MRQRDAQAELDAANPRREPWSPDRLGSLSYFNRVIKESMRLWPVAALGSSRVVEADIETADWIIPKGIDVIIPFFVLHR